ncbi:MAG: hypothetical protein AB7O97_05670 [Planctomycetota bacterium]
MRSTTRSALRLAPAAILPALLLAPAVAQADPLLFTLTQSETSISGSGGTSLANLLPNEIHELAVLCPPRAEKWAPRTNYHTQAGDEDGDDSYWEPGLFGQIDAVMAPLLSATPVNATNPRNVWFSPRTAMGTAVSGLPGLRPGDVGRIRRIGAADGQVEYFLRAEQVQIALGLPATPVVVNVDAIAAGFNFGVFFSLEDDIPANLCTGPVFVQDGAVLAIPPGAITWSSTGTVAAVAPGSAVVVHSEAAMNTFTQNARVTDRFGNCVPVIGDTDALEIDQFAVSTVAVPTCFGPLPVPVLVYAGETLTGGAILHTRGAGQIRPGLCGPYGTNCTFGPTLGDQIGVLPPSATVGIASSVNGLAFTRVCRFATESPTPQAPIGASVVIDVGCPAPAALMFVSVAPSGPAVVAPSADFTLGLLCYPEFYPLPTFIAFVPTPGGFGTYTSPPVPGAFDLIWQAATVIGSTWEISTPTTTETF